MGSGFFPKVPGADPAVGPCRRDLDRLAAKPGPGPLGEIETIAFGFNALLDVFHCAYDAVQSAVGLLLEGRREVRGVGAAGVQCGLAQFEGYQRNDVCNRDDNEGAVQDDVPATAAPGLLDRASAMHTAGRLASAARALAGSTAL